MPYLFTSFLIHYNQITFIYNQGVKQGLFVGNCPTKTIFYHFCPTTELVVGSDKIFLALKKKYKKYKKLSNLA